MPEVLQSSREDDEVRALRLAVRACDRGFCKIKKRPLQNSEENEILAALARIKNWAELETETEIDLLNREGLKN